MAAAAKNPPGTSTTKTTTKTTKAATSAGDKVTQAAKAKAAKDAADRYAAMARSFVPTTRAADMKAIQSLYPDYSGNILTDAMLRKNAQQDVGSVLNPQINNIANLYKRRGDAGSAAITGLTDIYTGRVKNWSDQVVSSNKADLSQMVGMNAALANFARDRNANLSGDLTGALQGMGASQQLTEQTAGVDQRLGDQASLDVAALGTGMDQRMAMEAMAMNNYAGLQPGFAAAQGKQQMGLFQGGLTAAMQEDLGDIRAKMPELVNQVYGQLLSNNNNQRTLKANRGQTLVGALGDADTNRLNTRIAGATIAKDLAGMAGQSESDWLTAMNSSGGSTTTSTTTATDPNSSANLPPAQRLAGAQAEYVGKLMETGRTSKFLDGPGIPSKYAVYHPGLVRKEIEKQLKARATGKLPQNLVTFYANRVMNDLGLPSTLPKAAGGQAPNPTSDKGFNFGDITDFIGDNPLYGASLLPPPIGGGATAGLAGAKSIYDWLWG